MSKIRKRDFNTKEWLPFKQVTEGGLIICDNSFIKILKVLPINYELKSNLEKEAILNSYKLFLKSCDFDIQIIIQSKKENLDQYFLNLKEISSKEENEKIKDISNDYIDYLNEKNSENKSSSKNFYVVLKSEIKIENKEQYNLSETVAINNLNEKYFKVKEALSRCGNLIFEINNKDDIEEILKSFFRK